LFYIIFHNYNSESAIKKYPLSPLASTLTLACAVAEDAIVKFIAAEIFDGVANVTELDAETTAELLLKVIDSKPEAVEDAEAVKAARFSVFKTQTA
jgi:hypothetical protein